jgi:hypothetical protein
MAGTFEAAELRGSLVRRDDVEQEWLEERLDLAAADVGRDVR